MRRMEFSREYSKNLGANLTLSSHLSPSLQTVVMAVVRDRAAWLSRNKNDTFVDAVAENLLDRLEDCKKSFLSAFCLGGSLGAVQRLLRGHEFLPIKESFVDLIISSLGLHWTNDLPGSYRFSLFCKLAMKPDGLFLVVILGGETLKELRIACTLAHMEREGGISPRLSPIPFGTDDKTI
ncbi:unnamed protein product [Eruca vesicaria subsp. sativa]|uniref:Uncharacterized protein n=1 Tax=Eruca vesicaria subsp. sativa TaxID=29727 RepID=A0ABC8M128_ERUVS|nr:unnamed protein product [Eruca vesicaria subsp. sativa]